MILRSCRVCGKRHNVGEWFLLECIGVQADEVEPRFRRRCLQRPLRVQRELADRKRSDACTSLPGTRERGSDRGEECQSASHDPPKGGCRRRRGQAPCPKVDRILTPVNPQDLQGIPHR